MSAVFNFAKTLRTSFHRFEWTVLVKPSRYTCFLPAFPDGAAPWFHADGMDHVPDKELDGAVVLVRVFNVPPLLCYRVEVPHHEVAAAPVEKAGEVGRAAMVHFAL